jgi:hypothetical protein
VVRSRATSGFGGGEVRLKVGPLGIGEVGEVCRSHSRLGSEPLSHNSFSHFFINRLPIGVNFDIIRYSGYLHAGASRRKL